MSRFVRERKAVQRALDLSEKRIERMLRHYPDVDEGSRKFRRLIYDALDAVDCAWRDMSKLRTRPNRGPIAEPARLESEKFMPSPTEDVELNIRHVADLYNTTEAQIEAWAREGIIPAGHQGMGGLRLWLLSELEASEGARAERALVAGRLAFRFTKYREGGPAG